jgi:uncharacterized protein (UPF0548 family)
VTSARIGGVFHPVLTARRTATLVLVLLSRRADPATLERFLARAVQEPLSYAEVGAILGDPPAGYRHDDATRVVGHGSDAFARAVEGLQEWRAHHAVGIRLLTSARGLHEGVTVAMALPCFGLFAFAACRLVAVVDEPDRFGFVYGTLRSHPEQGEESFMVTRAEDTVTFRISTFSRPADPMARLGAPVARRVQRRVTLAYLDGLAAFVGGR